MSATESSRPPAPVASTRQQLDELDALLQRMLELPVNQLDPDTPRPRTARPIPAPPEARPASVEPRIVKEVVAEPETEPQARPTPAAPSLPTRTTDDRPSPYMVIATVGPHVQPSSTELQNPIAPSGLGPRLLQAPTQTEEERPAAPEPPATGDSEENWVPLRSSWQPSAHSWQPLAESWQQRKLPAPAAEPPAEPAPKPAPAAVAAPEHPAPKETAETPKHEPITANPLAPLPLHAPAPEHMAALPQPLTLQDLEPPPGLLLSALRSFNQGFEVCLAPCGAVGRFLTSRGGRWLLGSLGALCLAAAALVVADRIGWIR